MLAGFSLDSLGHDLRVAGRTIPALRGIIRFGTPRVAWLSLGSNIGDRARYLRRGLEELQKISGLQILSTSQVYETEPVGPASRSFYNMAVEIATIRAPLFLLKDIQKVEFRLGRVRGEYWGSRTLDIDILAIEDIELDSYNLKLPHVEAFNRAFVMRPWLDIANPMFSDGYRLQDYMDILLEEDPESINGLNKIGYIEDLGY